ncbi:hypothetical protein IAC76_06080 [Spirochaetes bacterium]|uniref:SPOR domain-containing protein n=1 Tax=Candidatus Scatousia excrementipullorum TaxID=2840936 RepID=A0A9D9GZU6_9BACT|nr:hypothetical protein [Candidatus Scatousia excrementipullorum]
MKNEDYSQQTQSNSHISYKDYKKMLKDSNKKYAFKLFFWAFCVLLLIFLGIAKTMSPDVDITLGDESNNEMSIESEDYYTPRGEIDDRLRDIQMEDELSPAGSESLEVEDGEKVSIPEHTNRFEGTENKLPEELLGQKAVKDVVGPVQSPVEGLNRQDTSAHQVQQNHPSQTSAPAPAAAPTPAVPTVTARVIVGNYPTTEQAEVAKGILQEAGLGVTPFVRKMGSGYTLQVASYGSKEKAMSVAESLLNQNFPAKVVVEYKN